MKFVTEEHTMGLLSYAKFDADGEGHGFTSPQNLKFGQICGFRLECAGIIPMKINVSVGPLYYAKFGLNR